MAMEFIRRASGRPSHLAVFPGSFNPVTVAHVELVRAALPLVDEAVLVLPREFPHKPYVGASFAQRVQMLQAVMGAHPRISIGSTVRGLFVEIAEECRQAYGEHTRLTFLCGRDAAERIAGWDYGQPGAFARMLEQFDLLVAARHGEYAIPEPFRHAIQSLPLGGHFDHISASQVRDRIREGGSWEHLVPPEVRECVAAIYCVTGRPMDSTRGT